MRANNRAGFTFAKGCIMANEAKPFTVIPAAFHRQNVPELHDEPLPALDVGNARAGMAYLASTRNSIFRNALSAAILLRQFTKDGRWIAAWQEAVATEHKGAIKLAEERIAATLIAKLGGNRQVVICDNGHPTGLFIVPDFMAATVESGGAIWSADDTDSDLSELIAEAAAQADEN